MATLEYRKALHALAQNLWWSWDAAAEQARARAEARGDDGGHAAGPSLPAYFLPISLELLLCLTTLLRQLVT